MLRPNQWLQLTGGIREGRKPLHPPQSIFVIRRSARAGRSRGRQQAAHRRGLGADSEAAALRSQPRLGSTPSTTANRTLADSKPRFGPADPRCGSCCGLMSVSAMPRLPSKLIGWRLACPQHAPARPSFNHPSNIYWVTSRGPRRGSPPRAPGPVAKAALTDTPPLYPDEPATDTLRIRLGIGWPRSSIPF